MSDFSSPNLKSSVTRANRLMISTNEIYSPNKSKSSISPNRSRMDEESPIANHMSMNSKSSRIFKITPFQSCLSSRATEQKPKTVASDIDQTPTKLKEIDLNKFSNSDLKNVDQEDLKNLLLAERKNNIILSNENKQLQIKLHQAVGPGAQARSPKFGPRTQDDQIHLLKQELEEWKVKYFETVKKKMGEISLPQFNYETKPIAYPTNNNNNEFKLEYLEVENAELKKKLMLIDQERRLHSGEKEKTSSNPGYEIDRLKSEIKNLNEVIASLNGKAFQANELEKRFFEMKNEKDRLEKEKIEQMKLSNKDLEGRIKEQMQKMHHEIYILNNEKTQMIEEKNNLEKIYSDLKFKYVDLESHTNLLTRQLNELKINAQTLHKALEEEKIKNQELELFKIQNSGALEHVNELKEIKVRELERLLDIKKGEFDALVKRCNAMEVETRKKDDDLYELKLQIVQFDQIKKELDESRRERVRLIENIQNMERDKGVSFGQQSKLEKEINELRSLKNTISQLKMENDELRSQVGTIGGDLQRHKSEKEKTAVKLHEDNKKYEKELAEVNQKLAYGERQFNLLKNQYIELESKLQIIMKKFEEEKAKNYELELKKNQVEGNVSHEKELKELKIKELERLLEFKKVEIENFTKRCKSLEEESYQKISEINELRSQTYGIAMLKHDIDELKRENSKLRDIVHENDSKKEVFVAQQSKLEKEVNELRLLKDIISQLKKENEELRSQVGSIGEDFHRQKTEKEKTAAKLHEDNKKYEKELTEANQKQAYNERQYNLLKNHNIELETKLQITMKILEDEKTKTNSYYRDSTEKDNQLIQLHKVNDLQKIEIENVVKKLNMVQKENLEKENEIQLLKNKYENLSDLVPKLEKSKESCVNNISTLRQNLEKAENELKELRPLKHKLDIIMSGNEELKRDLKKIQDEKEKLLNFQGVNVKNLENSLLETNLKSNNFENQISIYKIQLQDALNHVQTLQSKLEEELHKNYNLNSKLNQLQESTEKNPIKIEELEKALELKKNECIETEKKFFMVEKNCYLKNMEITELKAKLLNFDQVSKELEELKNSTAFQHSLKKEVEVNLKNEFDALKFEHSKLEKEVNDLRSFRNDHLISADQNKDLQFKLSHIEKENEKLQIEKVEYELKLTRLNNELNAMKAIHQRVEKLQKENDALQNELDLLRSSSQKSNNDREGQKRIILLEDENQKLKKDFESLQNFISQFNIIISEKNFEIERLNNQITAQQKRIDDMVQDIIQLNNHIDSSHKLDARTDQPYSFGDLDKEDLRRVKSEDDGSGVSGLKKKIDDLCQIISKLENDRKNLLNEIDESENSASKQQHQKKEKTFGGKLKDQQKDMDKLELKNQELIKEIRDLKNKLENLQADYDNLNQKNSLTIDEKDRDINDLFTINDQLQNKIVDLNKIISDLEIQKIILVTEIERVDKKSKEFLLKQLNENNSKLFENQKHNTQGDEIKLSEIERKILALQSGLANFIKDREAIKKHTSTSIQMTQSQFQELQAHDTCKELAIKLHQENVELQLIIIEIEDQNENLTKKIETLSDELNMKIKNYNLSLNKQNQEIKKINQEHQFTIQKLANLEIENNYLKDCLNDATLSDSEVLSQDRRKNEKTADQRKLSLKKGSNVQHNPESSNELEILRKEVQEWRKRQADLDQKITLVAELERKVHNVLAENDSMSQKIDQLTREKEQLQKELQKLNDSVDSKHRGQNTKGNISKTILQSIETKFAAERTAYETQIMQLKQTIIELDTNLDYLAEENQKLNAIFLDKIKQSEESSATKGAIEALHALKANTEKLRNENISLQHDLVKLTAEKNLLKNKLEEKDKTLEASTHEIKRLTNLVAKANDDYQILLAEYEHLCLSNEQNQKNMTEIFYSKEKIEMMNREIESLIRERDFYRLSVDSMNLEVTLKNKELIEKIKEIDALKIKLESSIIQLNLQQRDFSSQL